MPAFERKQTGCSLRAYSEGDLLVALEKFKRGYVPDSAAGKVYHATLLLSVGQVAKKRSALRCFALARGRDALSNP